MKYYMAIDIGASSGRHILGWLDNGKIMTEEIYRFSNGPIEDISAFDGKKHWFWDVDRLYAEIINGLKKAKELNKIPYSVGVDTWGVDYALLDENDELIDKVFCYRDWRTEESSKKVHEIIPFSELFSRTGIEFDYFNTIYQLYDDKLSGKLDSAKSMLNLPDYFHFRLTGKKAHEYAMSTTTAMLNTKTRTWDYEIIDKLGFNKDMFVSVTAPSTEIGEFSIETQGIVGFNAKVILPATHDTASAVIGAPLMSETPYISSGTWSLLGIEQDYAHTEEQALKLNYSNEGGAEGKYRLQKSIMGLWILQQVRHETGDKYSFVELAEMARENENDYLIDVKDRRFTAPENMTAEINKAVGKELSIGETVYCILNSLAESYKKELDALEQITGVKYDTLNIIGGGSQNKLLNELTKKKTGKKIITGPTECTAIGNLFMQMMGNGEISDVLACRKIVLKSFDIKEV